MSKPDDLASRFQVLAFLGGSSGPGQSWFEMLLGFMQDEALLRSGRSSWDEGVTCGGGVGMVRRDVVEALDNSLGWYLS